MNRIQTHSFISAKLESFSDEYLSTLLEKTTPLHIGIDGKSFELTMDDHRIFVKKIPLAELEMKSENAMPTANLFNLPLFCQYGVGAPGFGSWRELIANQVATKWVLAKECENFSILYHWRLLPAQPAIPLNREQLENLENQIQFWENSSAVRDRFTALHSPKAEIVLFLEFIPQTLATWIKDQYVLGVEHFKRALIFTEKNLNLTIAFMKDHGLIHFDTHFENIMTDGQRLYFNDFGLVMSLDFDLTEEEFKFLEQHKNYDQCRAAVGFMHAVITCIYEKDNWKENLKSHLKSEKPITSPEVDAVIKKYAPLALAMLEFSQKLKTESKQTPFPAEQFALLAPSSEIIS